MTSTWAFDRADLPSTVHGLMSLWGGFDAPTNVTDSGCEKRLEVDVHVNCQVCPDGLLSVPSETWKSVFSHVNQTMQSSKREESSSLHWFRSEESILVILRDKIIATSSATTLLHQLLNPLIRICTESVKGCAVEWASFMRKNLASPWEPSNEMNHVMASEYAELKHTFPHGRSFLIGPVDSDHYFYFVHDAINRKASSDATIENDVQMNLVMYNVKSSESSDEKTFQKCTPIGKNGEFELQRMFMACGQRCVTFETNTASENPAERIAALLEEFQPDRCTLITLFDPQTTVAQRLSRGDRCGLDKFAEYNVENCCTNEFANGYVVRKMMFARTA